MSLARVRRRFRPLRRANRVTRCYGTEFLADENDQISLESNAVAEFSDE